MLYPLISRPASRSEIAERSEKEVHEAAMGIVNSRRHQTPFRYRSYGKGAIFFCFGGVRMRVRLPSQTCGEIKRDSAPKST
eukprot:2919928-Rhodomonas_salina.2